MIASPQPLSLRQKFGVLCRHAHVIAPWPVVCAVFIAGLWLWALSTIHREESSSRERAYDALAAQARTYADQIERTVGQLDYILLSLKFQWQKNGGTLRLEEQVEAGLVPQAARISVTVVDNTGLPVTSTIPGLNMKRSVAAVEYFQFHSTSTSRGLHVSKPAKSLLTGRDVVFLSRRIDGAGDGFGGVIVIAIEPYFLGSFVDESRLGESDFVAIRRSDGTFFATKTKTGFRSDAPNFIAPAIFESPNGVRSNPGHNYADGRPRIIAWHTTQSYPIVSIVGGSESSLLKEYRTRHQEILLVAIGGSILFFFIAVAGMRRTALRVWQSHYVTQMREAYRTATENAREGFYILRALYSHHNDIVDFIIEDCNERGAIYRGIPREHLIGKTVSAILPAMFKSQTLLACRHAMETGFYEDEMVVPQRKRHPKQWLQRRIVRSGGGLAVTLRDITESKLHQDALVRMANADTLTSLPNRHWLMSHLPAAIDHAQKSGIKLAIIFVDLDEFKNINDTQGHAVGDELLKAAALRLKAVIRPEDWVARLGGDEFTLIVQSAQTRDEIAAVAERVINTLRQPFVLGDAQHRYAIHASAGVSVFPEDGSDGQLLLKRADIAMYAAKTSKKGTYCFFDANQERRLLTRLSRQAELKLAVERSELVLHYQPRVRADSGEIACMEALVRWRHPVLGLIPPDEFIPIAEKTGLILPLGTAVIRMACAQLRQWKEQGVRIVPLSVNVSAQQIDAGNICTLLTSALEENELDARLLELEVTESATVTNDGDAVVALAAIQRLGIPIYVDDFGTGYSCLAQLKRLDMDGLKIDRAFTSQLLHGRADAALFEAIVSMAHALEMRVVAEGVETQEQLRMLQALSCEEVQGYYISRPVSAVDAVPLLEKRFLFPNTMAAARE